VEIDETTGVSTRVLLTVFDSSAIVTVGCGTALSAQISCHVRSKSKTRRTLTSTKLDWTRRRKAGSFLIFSAETRFRKKSRKKARKKALGC